MTVRKGWGVGGILLVVMLCGGTRAAAQFASSIEGTVTDASGAIVPGASVTITNEATGATQTVTTSGSGYYRFPALPGSTYTVRVTLSGFKTAVQANILLQAAETKTVNVTLESGQVEEEITVSGLAPLVETAEGRVSGLIETTQITNLPLMGRNFYSLVVLTPGVVGRATGGGQAYAQSNSDLYNNEFGVNMNANGARAESNNFLLDSSTVSSSQRSGVVNINPNSESVQEVRISVNNFSAEFGRNGSVLVNVITKSGTNELNGSLGTYYTNNTLQSKNHFQKQATGFSHPDYGRTEVSWGAGGPVTRNRTFFFTSGDVLRSDVAVSGARTIMTPEFIRFMEQARPNNVSTFIAKNYPASFAPDRNFRTAGQHLNAACAGSTPIASPIGPVPCNLPVTGEGTWNETSPRNGFQWTARVDHQMREGQDRIYGSFSRTTTDKVGFGTPEVYPGFTAASPTSSMHFSTNWTRILSPTTLNEVSFAWVRPWGELLNHHPDIPGVTVTGIAGYQVGWGPNEFVQNSFEWRDVLTMTRGSHTLKLGGGYTREHADNEASRVFNRPTYSFNSVFDFASDQAFGQQQIAIDPATADPITRIIRFHRTQSVSGFVQNDWKARPNLSINAGLRYEGYFNIYNTKADMANIQFTTEGDLQSRLASARMVQRHYYLEGGLLGGGMHTLAPRVSFAWDPTNSATMSIRGGIGRSYDRMSNQIWDGEYQNLPAFAALSVTIQDPVSKPVFGLGQSTTVPYNYPRPTGLSAGLNEHGGLLNGAGVVHVVDSDIEPMYLDNWFLGFQRSLGTGVVVEADYIGSRGNNAYRKWDINRFNGDLFDGRLDRILPGFAGINYSNSTDWSSFHGGTISAKMLRRALSFGGAYTFGRATDYSSTFSATQLPDAYGPSSQDKGRADFDVPQKLSLWSIWMIPGPPSGMAKAIFGGWQATGVLIAQSGTPFTVFCQGRAFAPIRDGSGAIVGNSGCDYNADGLQFDRPNVPSFGDSRSGLSNDDFLNGIFQASDFPTPAPGSAGTLGRNTFRGPRYFNVDFALIRSITVPAFGRNGVVQLRLETFNLFNTTNLLPPQSNLTSAAFGRSTDALPGRIVQLGARISF
ncbi:MAG TPA: TonB-dependent receptor [Vicinamibacterales bacterium]|nr:TonB-dependent receptor [Vicinamibacterales bacterium]